MRIAVVGTSGSGKTTLARALAARLLAPHVELDALHWGPGWTAASDADFREAVTRAISGEAWVCDGNYRVVSDFVWARATDVVWLDYTLPTVLRRAVWRTLRRTLTGEELYGGNRESWRAVIDKDWIPWWVIRTHRANRRRFTRLLADPRNAHLRAHVLARPSEVDAYLESLQP